MLYCGCGCECGCDTEKVEVGRWVGGGRFESKCLTDLQARFLIQNLDSFDSSYKMELTWRPGAAARQPRFDPVDAHGAITARCSVLI